MTSTNTVRLAALVLLLAGLSACSRKRADEPEVKVDPTPAGPGPLIPIVQPKPPGTTLPGTPPPVSPWAATAIPLEGRPAVTFGVPGCPVLIVGTDVYETTSYKPVRKLAEPYEAHARRSLTPDGRYFAVAAKSPNQTDTAVSVYSTETGERVLEVPGQKEAYVDVLGFHGNNYLLLGGRHNRDVEAWDIQTKKVVGKLTVPDRRVEPDSLAFSADSKYFAGLAHDKLIVTDMATNKPVATMAAPGAEIGKSGKPTDPIFVYAWTRGLAFSPDGTELALFSTHPSPRLLVWSVKGQMLIDLPVPMPGFVTHRNTLEWLPDGGGWLVNGHLVDRTTRRVVVSVRVPFASDVLPHMLDRDRVIGVFGDDRDRLQTITLPWAKLNDSLKAMAERTGAYLAPGDSVTLQIDLTGLRGDEAETRTILTDAITKRLARDGITVAAGQPTVFRLKLSEQAGDTLPIYQRQSPFDFRGADTGRKATEAKGAAVMELWAPGEAQPLWRGHLTAASSRSFSEEITDATVRKSMLEHLSNQLSGMDVPYFLPKTRDVVALPAVVE